MILQSDICHYFNISHYSINRLYKYHILVLNEYYRQNHPINIEMQRQVCILSIQTPTRSLQAYYDEPLYA